MKRNALKIAVFLSFALSKGLLAADPQQQSAFGSFLPLILIFIIFYFFLIRPQQRKSKEHQKMLNELKKDDKIITAGGIYGVVSQVKGEIVEVKIAESVKVQVAKGSISAVIPETQTGAVTPEIIK